MLDRTIAPPTVPIGSIPLITPTNIQLSNGTPTYFLNTGTQEVIKIDLWFDTGAVDGARPNLTASAIDLIREGTTDHSAKEIAEKLDGFGAFMETNTYKERACVSLYCLSKFSADLIPFLAEIVTKSSFPQQEVETYANKNYQNLQTDLEKTGIRASRGFSSNLFGESHPYSRISTVEDWSNLDRDSIIEHHKNVLLPSLSRIMVSGLIPEGIDALLDAAFGNIDLKGNSDHLSFPAERATDLVNIEMPNVVQNAIKVGRPMFNRLHPDFVGMQVLVTVLGGYFGSRLMSNIREDKGYTYGISASLQTLNHSGYLMIGSEVGSDVCDATILEIEKELNRLCTETIPADELDLVISYIMGQQLNSIDGPFSLASKWNGLLNFGLTAADFEDQINQMKAVSSENLMALANKYLRPEMMMHVVAGKI